MQFLHKTISVYILVVCIQKFTSYNIFALFVLYFGICNFVITYLINYQVYIVLLCAGYNLVLEISSDNWNMYSSSIILYTVKNNIEWQFIWIADHFAIWYIHLKLFFFSFNHFFSKDTGK